MKRLILLSTRRLDLNVVPRPAAQPRSGLLRSKPLARKLSTRIIIRKVSMRRPAERRKARNTMPELARPIIRPKVIQHTYEHFENLFDTMHQFSASVFFFGGERT
jgi:hypothetical protein